MKLRHSLIGLLLLNLSLNNVGHAIDATRVPMTSSTTMTYQLLDQVIQKSAQDARQYQAIRLANEMTVLLVSDQQAPKSLAAVALPIGSLDDPNSQLGLAHYLEHMVLMGSAKFPAPDGLAEFLSQHGGRYNASTAAYRTSFYLEIANDALADAVMRLADTLANPLLDAKYADKERHAVNAEMTKARTSDGMRMAQVDAETLNPLHPAARFSGGNLETLSDKADSLLHPQLTTFYQHYYSSNLMVGVIYGNRSIAELATLAAESFGQIENKKAQVPAIKVPIATPAQEGVIIHYVPEKPQKQLRIDFHPINNQTQFRTKSDEYISYLLTSRAPNTLADWLVKQGLIEDITTGIDAMSNRNHGIFTIAFALTDKGIENREAIIAALFSYLDLIKRQGLQADYYEEMAKVLALNFSYLSVNRDMRYIETLADRMLRYPIEHVLDGPYLADHYDPDAISQRLQGMTVQKARFWYISQQEPYKRNAYFVNAPYQVDTISKQQLALWQQTPNEPVLSLPTLNPYIADNFSLVKKSAVTQQPHWSQQQKNLRIMMKTSDYFAYEPKANITVALRYHPQEINARNEVIAQLTDYLANLALDQLSYQAAIGGVSLSHHITQEVLFQANGFSQHLPTLLTDYLSTFQHFSPNELQLSQAKSWYREQLAASNKGAAYQLALKPINALTFPHYHEQSLRLEEVEDITLSEILTYRDQLFKEGKVELFINGNLDKSNLRSLSKLLQKTLNTRRMKWWHGEYVAIKHPIKAYLTQTGSSSDSALAAIYVPLGYDEVNGQAHAQLLASIIHPWFFNQLRTEEQLGYALFAYPQSLGKQWGIGFLLQSHQKSPADLYQRYLNFYQLAESRLQAMEDITFQQYKKALLDKLQEHPQTLNEESARYWVDFNQSNYKFDRQTTLIEAVKQINHADLMRYFHEAIIEPNGLALLSQLQGKQEQTDHQFVQPEGWQSYDDVTTLQQQLSIEVAT